MRIERLLGLLLAATLTATAASPAFAVDDPRVEEASRHYRQGVEFFNEKAYGAALVEFRRAYELAPNPHVLYNIGQIQMIQRDDAGALVSFERYLREAGTSVPADRRASVERDLAKLRERVAHLEVSTNVSEGDVAIDDVVVAHLPVHDSITVSAGRRHVAIVRGGQEIASRWLELAAGDHAKVSLDVAPEPTAATPPPVAPTPPPEAPARSTTPMYIAWGGAGAMLVGAGVTGALALGASSSLSTDRSTPGVSRATLDDAQSKVKRYAIMSDVLTGAGVVLAGVALYITLSPSHSKTEQAALRLQLTGTGGALSGTF